MIEIVEEEQERREPKTLEEYIEQMEESEKKKLFDYLKGREGKKDDENNKERGRERLSVLQKKGNRNKKNEFC